MLGCRTVELLEFGVPGFSCINTVARGCCTGCDRDFGLGYRGVVLRVLRLHGLRLGEPLFL